MDTHGKPAYYKANRTEEAWELMTRDHSAFVLLSQIAYRARRTTTDPVTNLAPGQAFIGDCERCGFTEQVYRTAKAHLQKYGFATFKPTTKGTIATIVGTSIYDINIDAGNGQTNVTPTDSQRTANGQPTTNKNVKNEKKGKNEKKSPPTPQGEEAARHLFEFWNRAAGRSVEKEGTTVTWHGHKKLSKDIVDAVKLRLKDYSLQEIEDAIRNYGRVLLSGKYYWSYSWSMVDFLTRKQGREKGSPLQIVRFLPDNFHADQWTKRQSGEGGNYGPASSNRTGGETEADLYIDENGDIRSHYTGCSKEQEEALDRQWPDTADIVFEGVWDEPPTEKDVEEYRKTHPKPEKKAT